MKKALSESKVSTTIF